MGPDAWLKALGGLPLSYPPGERFHYSHATDVLGFLVGRIAGKPFRDVLFERIFDPLGMVDTDFYVPPEKHGRAAKLYRLKDDFSALEDAPFPLRRRAAELLRRRRRAGLDARRLPEVRPHAAGRAARSTACGC